MKKTDSAKIRTAEEAKSFLDYDSQSGLFRWTNDVGYKIKRGQEAGSVTSQGYIAIIVRGISYKAHRIAWLITYGAWPVCPIDHINGERSDNRIANLREATLSSNAQNQRDPHKNNKSGFLGVCWHKENKRWLASIRVSNKTVHIGYFDTPEQAHLAYVERKRELHPACTI